MIIKTVVVQNRAGLHTRPAATIVKKAARYHADFMIIKDGFRINGKSIIGVMTLAAEQGCKLELEFNGEDEEAAANDIVSYFESKFDEEY